MGMSVYEGEIFREGFFSAEYENLLKAGTDPFIKLRRKADSGFTGFFVSAAGQLFEAGVLYAGTVDALLEYIAENPDIKRYFEVAEDVFSGYTPHKFLGRTLPETLDVVQATNIAIALGLVGYTMLTTGMYFALLAPSPWNYLITATTITTLFGSFLLGALFKGTPYRGRGSDFLLAPLKWYLRRFKPSLVFASYPLLPIALMASTALLLLAIIAFLLGQPSKETLTMIGLCLKAIGYNAQLLAKWLLYAPMWLKNTLAYIIKGTEALFKGAKAAEGKVRAAKVGAESVELHELLSKTFIEGISLKSVKQKVKEVLRKLFSATTLSKIGLALILFVALGTAFEAITHGLFILNRKLKCLFNPDSTDCRTERAAKGIVNILDVSVGKLKREALEGEEEIEKALLYLESRVREEVQVDAVIKVALETAQQLAAKYKGKALKMWKEVKNDPILGAAAS
jgi:hypothetical protein